MSSRYSGDPRVDLGEFSVLVRTPKGQVEITTREVGAIHRRVASGRADGAWSALDTYHAEVDDAIDAVLGRHW